MCPAPGTQEVLLNEWMPYSSTGSWCPSAWPSERGWANQEKSLFGLSLWMAQLFPPWVILTFQTLARLHPIRLWKVKESEVAQSCPTPYNPIDCSLPGSSVHGIFQARGTGVACHCLLQGIFLTQGSNPGLPHCRQTLYRLSHQAVYRHTLWLWPLMLPPVIYTCSLTCSFVFKSSILSEDTKLS